MLLGLCVVVLALEFSYGFCLQDDAYISFRYAENWVNGDGLVFNPGERVEGYSNLLWTLGIGVGLVAGVQPEVWVYIGGLLASVLLVAALWQAGLRRGLGPWQAAVAPAFVGLHGGFALEAVQGLETVAFALLVFVTAEGVCAAKEGRASGAVCGAAGMAVLMRPEGVGVALLVGMGSRLGSARWPKVLLAVAVLVALAQLGFRWSYYGEFLPNTFYAKTGLGAAVLTRGFGYVVDFFVHMPHLLLGAALYLPARFLVGIRSQALGAQSRDVHSVLIVGYVTYVIAVGGDFKGTGRFLLPVLPSLALLAQGAFWALLNPERPRHVRVAWAMAVGIALLLFAEVTRCSAWADQSKTLLLQRLAVGETLAAGCGEETRLAVHSSGVLPYAAGLPTLDMWGLNDRHIARAPIGDRGQGKAGHEARDYAYVLTAAPDLLLPEGGLTSEYPIELTTPDVLPAAFADLYVAFSAPISRDVRLRLGAGASAVRFYNGWRRRVEGEEEAPYALVESPCLKPAGSQG